MRVHIEQSEPGLCLFVITPDCDAERLLLQHFVRESEEPGVQIGLLGSRRKALEPGLLRIKIGLRAPLPDGSPAPRVLMKDEQFQEFADSLTFGRGTDNPPEEPDLS
jgi:hypothetical protein